MLMRRRPLLRAAMVGGTAYYAGKKVARGRRQEAEQNTQIFELRQQQYQQQAQTAPSPPPAAAPAAGYGDCPIDRFVSTPDGEPVLNHLCPGFNAFFHHIDAPMRRMCDLLRAGRAPSEIVAHQRENVDQRL